MPERIAILIDTLRLPATNQTLADLALAADQERRRALKARNRTLAREHDDEVRRLAKLIR